ncbi:RidA family protein [Acetonema longum]|uniref:Endoribonuclease L-PSP n=1 Tax=Acetonema longum DSM 6540 TaxID=1009370 RepID=F7NF17_9FIRM|nr:Rid family detoxifying hydrolase [Acetonema longum]EGO65578.1 endoribonuclease L-PSP [Acetonema longum DSM 6540]
MSIEFISSPELPKAVGPYSYGTKYGNIILTSGQIAMDPKTGEMVTEIKAATKMVLGNLLSVVVAGGGRLDTIARVDVYLKDLKDFNAFNDAYAEFFGSHKPARVTVQAGDLAEGATVEAAVTAFAIM